MKQFLVLVAFLFLLSGCISSPTLSSVQEAKEESTDTEVTLEGYIVGVPTSVHHITRQEFPNDYAVALADKRDETRVDEMIFVQLSSEFRQAYGLHSNPDLFGRRLVVTGVKEDYFSHDGIKRVTNVSLKTPNEDTELTDEYYEKVKGLKGENLKNALNDVIDAHTELSYDDAWSALKELDENPAKKEEVLLLYSGVSLSEAANGGGVDEWNREHVWPKSHGNFGTTMGAGTDLHHLKPADTTVNSSRSNLDFDNGGEAQGEAPDTFSDKDSFEPRDEVKGDVARMVFYMAVRYEGEHEGEPDLELVERVGTSGPVLGKLSTLKQWHEQDPVSEAERKRNDLIYSDYQGNRNPFIDHPEYVELIW